MQAFPVVCQRKPWFDDEVFTGCDVENEYKLYSDIVTELSFLWRMHYLGPSL